MARAAGVAVRMGGILLLAVATGCGARRVDPPVDRSEDPRIQREVEARLAAEPSIDPGAVRVAVEGGVVTLHGSVAGIGAWQCALRNAALVQGVVTVAGYLVLERGPRDVPCRAPPPGDAPEGSSAYIPPEAAGRH